MLDDVKTNGPQVAKPVPKPVPLKVLKSEAEADEILGDPTLGAGFQALLAGQAAQNPPAANITPPVQKGVTLDREVMNGRRILVKVDADKSSPQELAETVRDYVRQWAKSEGYTLGLPDNLAESVAFPDGTRFFEYHCGLDISPSYILAGHIPFRLSNAGVLERYREKLSDDWNSYHEDLQATRIAAFVGDLTKVFPLTRFDIANEMYGYTFYQGANGKYYFAERYPWSTEPVLEFHSLEEVFRHWGAVTIEQLQSAFRAQDLTFTGEDRYALHYKGTYHVDDHDNLMHMEDYEYSVYKGNARFQVNSQREYFLENPDYKDRPTMAESLAAALFGEGALGKNCRLVVGESVPAAYRLHFLFSTNAGLEILKKTAAETRNIFARPKDSAFVEGREFELRILMSDDPFFQEPEVQKRLAELKEQGGSADAFSFVEYDAKNASPYRLVSVIAADHFFVGGEDERMPGFARSLGALGHELFGHIQMFLDASDGDLKTPGAFGSNAKQEIVATKAGIAFLETLLAQEEKLPLNPELRACLKKTLDGEKIALAIWENEKP